MVVPKQTGLPINPNAARVARRLRLAQEQAAREADEETTTLVYSPLRDDEEEETTQIHEVTFLTR